MKKLFLALGLFGFLSIGLSAQDIHFSQFYMSPLNLNPAMTGVMNCNTRMIANYRNQWAAALGANAYNTYSASYDQKLAVGRSDYFGVGAAFWGDVAGQQSFGTTQGKLALSYSKKMGGYRRKAHYLVMGAEAAVTQRRVSKGDARWPNQVVNGVHDPNIPGGVITNDKFIFETNAGLIFTIDGPSNKVTIRNDGEFEFTGNLTVTGDIVSSGGDVVSDTGKVEATAGNVVAGVNVEAGANVVATTKVVTPAVSDS